MIKKIKRNNKNKSHDKNKIKGDKFTGDAIALPVNGYLRPLQYNTVISILM
jgi:hypothetical protein